MIRQRRSILMNRSEVGIDVTKWRGRPKLKVVHEIVMMILEQHEVNPLSGSAVTSIERVPFRVVHAAAFFWRILSIALSFFGVVGKRKF